MEINLKMVARCIYFLFAIGLLLATITSMIIQIISLDGKSYEETQFVSPILPKPENDHIIIDDKSKHLFVFVQISDIHLSVHFDFKRKKDFKTFCNKVVDIVKPKVVIASGDLTDSRSKNPLGSKQYEQEWIWYAETLNETRVTEKTSWLDLRGNHDNFNLLNWNSSENFYRKYSFTGKHHIKHYNYSFKEGNDLYTFVAVDACFYPSPKRPFNFVGILDNNDIDLIEKIRDDSIKKLSNFTIWFGHYPTSSIAMPTRNIRHVINGPYLCGHFHTLSGLVKEMYATHKEGSLELEVGDFKDNRIFRVAAVDHGIFSFVDTRLNQWPIILITNPKASRFNMPGYEPLFRIKKSTHIRVLVYSPVNIVFVLIKINNSTYKQMDSVQGNPNLFVFKWNPNEYLTGLHQIQIKAKDLYNNVQIVNHEFSLDGTKNDFAFGAKFLLRVSIRSFGVFLYLSGLIVTLIPFLTSLYLHSLRKGRILKTKSKYSFFYKCLFKLYLLGSIKKIFYILLFIPFYLFVGPLYIGHLLTDKFGLAFIWGMFIDGIFIPTALTYVWGLLILILFHLPITIIVSHIIYCNYIKLENGIIKETFFKRYFHIRHFFLIFIVFCNSLISFNFIYAYGLLTFFFGFGITWTIILYLIVWKMTFNITIVSFPEEIRPKFKKSNLEDSLILEESE